MNLVSVKQSHRTFKGLSCLEIMHGSLMFRPHLACCKPGKTCSGVQSVLSSVNARSPHGNMAKAFLCTFKQYLDKYLFKFSCANIVKIGFEYTP